MAGGAGRVIVAGLLALGGAAAVAVVPPVGPAAALAGRYADHFRNMMVDGTEFWSDDVVEVVPVDPSHAYVRLSLNFYNGHSCSLAGVAEARSDTLVYQGPPDDRFLEQPPCRLTIRRSGGELAWDDDDGSCKAHCGARGSLHGGGLPWQSRRPIRYLPRLRASSEYRDALAAWRRSR